MKLQFHEADLPGDKRQPDELLRLGWTLHDIEWTNEATWKKILFVIIGEENMKVLAMTRLRDRDQVRGQLMISPLGFASCESYLRHRKAPT